MSDLQAELIRQITRLGPITIAEYMNQCLYHPTLGYYTNAAPLGAAGDFITAPEVSQMFGEMLGLALAQNWLDQGAPTPFCLAELGAGSGQLMEDVLRATKGVTGFHEAMRLYVCDVNPSMMVNQALKLADFEPNWVSDVTKLPTMPLFLLANEFFDCLPIRQFVRAESEWQEQLVAVENDTLCFALKPAGLLGQELPQDAPIGAVVELCPAANAIMADIARQIAANGGCALVFDYGDWGSNGDSLQALRQHQKVEPLEHPGTSDLTAHVDFQALALAARPFAQTSAMIPQGPLLELLGITSRAQALAANLRNQALTDHIAAHRRLTHPEEMGKLFKALAITPKGASLPPGFPHDT